ncbi:uncharacterized protein TRAVEDRAFT_54854 [Trametes versicolor FP-101664 SS1]|uniref:Uncharacterized protein n=1 Tax=Trametes versicolor (strain FP-101664) TaxID=717944 RepID=R7S6J2_TRAVS|nr:uncharacterized protein TRAVEDRAFT_54854 [Trametes versicolor FP-101664 SS1]EIW51142.1 hypothetical protein TRAVEDRAFT_54854 [Trametes versicolor FP-101664 SS1]
MSHLGARTVDASRDPRSARTTAYLALASVAAQPQWYHVGSAAPTSIRRHAEPPAPELGDPALTLPSSSSAQLLPASDTGLRRVKMAHTGVRDHTRPHP